MIGSHKMLGAAVCSAFKLLPSKLNSKIVSAHSTYEGAARVAAIYVLDNNYLVCDNEDHITKGNMEYGNFVLAHLKRIFFHFSHSSAVKEFVILILF